ncbi:MAG: ACT domain-containing protein, partial [Polyangiales bacterium]
MATASGVDAIAARGSVPGLFMKTTPAADTATLLVSCPDRKGLVAALGQLLYGHGLNILDASQHTDVAAGQFFQRIRFDLR